MRIVVKVGTSTLTHETGRINIRRIENLCKVLSDIKNGVKHNIRVYIKWINNEDNNEIDSNIGLEKGYSINIPVNIVIKQFLG